VCMHACVHACVRAAARRCVRQLVDECATCCTVWCAVRVPASARALHESSACACATHACGTCAHVHGLGTNSLVPMEAVVAMAAIGQLS